MVIPAEILRSCCERGYARTRCGIAATVQGDAVQFLAHSERNGIIQIAWSLERDHHPIAVGTADAANPATGDVILDAQIQAVAAKLPRP